jgi:FHA domain-containing protein/A-macroglobulin complement component/alpha-2-macroglobulin family protein/MG2 domain-containing protein
MTAHLVIKTGDTEQVVVLGPMNSLGRHPNNSIQILDKIASKEHCLIERRGDHYVLRDLGSLNGTFINSVRVRDESRLVDGDEISIGSTRGIFRCGAPAADAAIDSVSAISSVPGSLRPVFPDERLLAHLATDKPLYRPGEVLYARAALLDAFTRAPALRGGNLAFEVRSPRGDVVVSRPAPVARGISAFSWAIPDDVVGGEYVLFARCPAESFPPAEMAFGIRPLRVPLLRLELELARKAYGPGDEVVAALSVTRAEGGVPAAAVATVVAVVDGLEVHRSEIAIDASGVASLRFRLPLEIDGGDGALAVTVQDGGVSEPVARVIPIARQRLGIAFYPEGGDLVVGLPGRVYVEARTPRGRPVDVAGRVLDSSGAVVARFRTEHEGRGSMALLPARSGRAYIALVDEPAGVAEIFPLPEIKRDGFALAALDDVTGIEEPVRLRVTAAASGKARVTLSVREREVAAMRIDLVAGEPREIALTPPGSSDGVLRATVLDAAGVPRAERLVFRRPSRSLRVTVEMRCAGPAPPSLAGGPPRAGLRSPVLVRVKTTDAEGVPRAATVTIAVTDDTLLGAIVPRERAPNLAEQALLGGEVLDFADPAAYLGADEAAPRRLDLLLGTQGFRRFAFLDIARFAAEHGDRAERVLARQRSPSGALAQAALLVPKGAHAARVPEARLAEMKTRYLVAPARAAGPPPRLIAPILPPGWAPERGRRVAPRPEPPLLVVREYAHRAAAPFEGAAGDLTETIYWHAGVTTSPGGEAQVTFDLSDAATTFRARADAFSDAGALGHGESLLEATRPFSVEARLPLEVTAGDHLEVPIAVTNGTATHADVNVSLWVNGGFLAGRDAVPLSLREGRRERVRLPLAVMKGRGVFPVTVRASAGLRGDEITRSISVFPAGFPRLFEASGRLDPDGAAVHVIRLPAAIEPGSIATELVLHPSPVASLMAAREALAPDPAGGFEPAASCALIEALTLQVLLARRHTEPRALQRAADAVERGHARLVAFERKEGGFEWFGGDPGHAALTAWGLLVLAQMARVFPVDPALVKRTRDWILARRDGRGGFLADGAPAPSTALADAYIVWALGRAGVTDLAAEITAAEEQALASDDAYHLALATNAVLEQGAAADAARLIARLADRQGLDGAVRGAATSITRSSGDNLVVETTSLAILAWLRGDEPGRAALAVRWLLDHGSGGRFGATQATALAVQALVAFESTRARPKQAGVIQVLIDGAPCVTAPFGAGISTAIIMPSFADDLGPGDHQLTVRMSGGVLMPYTLRVRASTPEPPSAPLCKVALTTSLDRAELPEGEALELRAVLANVTGDALPMVTAILGLPAGLEATREPLIELVAQAKIDAWEIRGREIVIHLRTMAPAERRVIAIALVASAPGTTTGPASRAYLQYTDEEKHWTGPLKVRVIARR